MGERAFAGILNRPEFTTDLAGGVQAVREQDDGPLLGHGARELGGRRAHAYGEPTDVAYLRIAHRLAASGAPWSIATHDGRLREAVHLALGPVPVEQLPGGRPEVLDDLRTRGVPTRVYVPYGPDWFRYWLRRLAESRGA